MSRDGRPILRVSAGRPPTGHVFRVERASRPVWVREVPAVLRPAGPEEIGWRWAGVAARPSVFFTKRAADAWLLDLLDQARRGTPPGMVVSGATFAYAAAEWLQFIEEDRARRPSTLNDHRSALNAHLLPAFGNQPLESVTPERLVRADRRLCGRHAAGRPLSGILLVQRRGLGDAPSVAEIRGDGGPVGWLHSEGGGFLLDRGVSGLLRLMIVPRPEPARLDGGASAVDGDDRAGYVASLRRGGEGDNARDLFDAGGPLERDRRPSLADPVLAQGLD